MKGRIIRHYLNIADARYCGTELSPLVKDDIVVPVSKVALHLSCLALEIPNSSYQGGHLLYFWLISLIQEPSSAKRTI